MEKFTFLRGIAAPLPLANIDTDKIIAARYLKTIGRHGLGAGLFSALRYDEDHREREEFILNRQPWCKAQIIVALENFGCGSSREHAPWALTDFGIRSIIAPSFADIFYNNCFKNGILPIIVDRSLIDTLMNDASDPTSVYIEIDLPEQTIRRANGDLIHFEIPPEHKNALLLGIDEIRQTEALNDEITNFEANSSYCVVPIPIDILDTLKSD